MSISLDIALYLREKGKDYINLDLSTKAVLFILAFRVGSNPYTWISQKELAKELNINERNTRKHTSKLKELGLIIIDQDKKDKRKNLYRPAEFLVNYHKENSKKSRSNETYNFENTGLIRPTNNEDTGHIRPVFKEKNESQPIDNNEENQIKNSPKGTLKDKETLKDKTTQEQKRKKLVSREIVDIEIPDWIDKETWNDFKQHRISLDKPMTELSQKKMIKLLDKMRSRGQNIEDVLNQSIANSWQGVFEIKQIKEMSHGNQQSKPKSVAQRVWERNTAGLPEFENYRREREVPQSSEDFRSLTEFLF